MINSPIDANKQFSETYKLSSLPEQAVQFTDI